jgi:hypothetical protein
LLGWWLGSIEPLNWGGLVSSINILNEEAVFFQPLPAETYAGPTPITIIADASLNLETDGANVPAVLTLTMASLGKPPVAPTTLTIVLKKGDGPKWHRISITGRFTCATPEFLTVSAECALRWDSGGEAREIKLSGVLSLAVPAKPKMEDE